MELLGIPFTTVATGIAVIVLTVLYYIVKSRNVLPGPRGVPYLGLYPFLKDEDCHKKLDGYKKEYGDVFSFTYSGRLFINLGSIKAMREAQMNQSDCFSERFTDFHALTCMLGKGVFMANGEPWKVLRKFFTQRFRDYGLNTVRDNMVGPVYDSLNSAINDLAAMRGKPINVVDILTQRCTGGMRKVLFGEDGITDEELDTVTGSYIEALEGAQMGTKLLLIGPFARLLFNIKPSLRKAMNHHRKLSEVLYRCCKRIDSSMNEDAPTCMIEDYYKERNDRLRNNDPTWKIFTDDALVPSVFQFIGDGIGGVAAFITGFLSAAILHPEEQEKLYAELMEVVGPNRQPVLEDKANLPYVNAFMNEVIRKSTFLCFFPSLECTKETTVCGYRIPKGSITLLNFWSAHHDSNTFEDPDKFNPSRYMPVPGKPKPESPVLFGMGKRSCFGEAFVMRQSFMFLTTIVKNFRITSSIDPSANSANSFIIEKLEVTLYPRLEN